MCELCKAKAEATADYVYFFVVVCRTCNIPMLVLGEHRNKLTKEEERFAELLRKKYFPDKKFRGYMREIFDHWHDHLI